MLRTQMAAIALVCGVVFAGNAAPSRAASYQVLYTFQGGSDGAYSYASLTNVGGTLYGTTEQGGSPKCDGGCGTVFSLDLTTGTEAVVHYFRGGSDGAYPAAGLIRVGDRLYGMTLYGGGSKNCKIDIKLNSCGTVFSLDPTTGAEKVVYAFQGGSDGANPTANMINVGGRLFGTTGVGGGSTNCFRACGTVFSLDPKTGAEKVVYAFQGGSDGAYPSPGLIDVGGTLYGTTVNDGSTNCYGGCGTVFSLDPKTGAKNVAYSFQGGSDGGIPLSGLIKVGGALYGTTDLGGASEEGTVFSLDLATGAEKAVYSFPGGNDGASPDASVINVGSMLYGTTPFGGGSTNCPGGCGTVFSLSRKTRVERVLYSFQGGSDGASPNAGLINVGGTLYGTTTEGGGGYGTVFAITP